MEHAHAGTPAGSDYILGHAQEELDRLVEQGRFFGDLTEQVLRMAGLGPGQRVLDAGCGMGDVTFLAARMVGREGEVIGIDRSAEVVCAARRRAEEAGLQNVRFLTADLAEVQVDEPVDALIGRFILMYLPDPAAVLRRLLQFVKPGGLVVFQEMDMEGADAVPDCPEYRTAGERLKETFSRAGIDTRAGLRLPQIFRAAGLPTPQLLQGARVECGPDSRAYAFVEQITRTVLPLMERTGVASAQEVDVGTLAERIRADAVARQSVLVLPPLVGAWARRRDGA